MGPKAPWLRHAETMKARAWLAADAGRESSWRCPLHPRNAGAIFDLARTIASGPVPLVETRLADSDRLAWSGGLAAVADALENGRGFAIVHLPSEEHLSLEIQLALYWAVGQVLGEPVTQNVAGSRLYDVRDTGQSLNQGARFSVTNYESTFHTDASFEDDVVDYVGLLCVRTAKSGGLSQLVSGYSAAADLAQADPAAIEVLAQPFHVDRRGGVRPGEAPTAQRPVLARRGDEIVYRYLRTWIEAGHDKAGVPLTDDQVRALDTLDATLSRGDLRVEFMLRPGDMLWINNRWLLHNRTAFEDHAEPAQRRHYVRLWLRRRAEDVAGDL
ncbi:MAG: TauD/TfdA family dioxygenase [Isosphaeraceae bacterium]